MIMTPEDYMRAERDEIASVEREWVPFPLRTLPDSLRSFAVEVSESVGVDPAFVAVPMLGVLGAAIGNSRWALLKAGWTEPPALWVAVLARSGATKSPAMRPVVEPILAADSELLRELERKREAYQYEKDTFDSQRRNGSDYPRPTEPVEERVVVENVTIEGVQRTLHGSPRGLLAFRDELSGWVAAFGEYKARGSSADESEWLTLYDGGRLTVTRGGKPTRLIDRALVSVVGGIQPRVVRRVFGRDRVDNGLLARLLLVRPPVTFAPFSTRSPDPKAQAWYARVVAGLLEMQGLMGTEGYEPRFVRVSDPALGVYEGWFNANQRRTRLATDDLGAALSKMRGRTIRLALILELAGSDAPGAVEEVGEDAMRRACELADWFADEAERIYASAVIASPDDEGDDEDLLALVEALDGEVLTARILMRRRSRFRKDSDAATARLRRLVEDHPDKLEWVEVGRLHGAASVTRTTASVTSRR